MGPGHANKNFAQFPIMRAYVFGLPFIAILHVCSAGMAFSASERYCTLYADGGCQDCSTLTQYGSAVSGLAGECFECASGQFDDDDCGRLTKDKTIIECCSVCASYDHNKELREIANSVNTTDSACLNAIYDQGSWTTVPFSNCDSEHAWCEVRDEIDSQRVELKEELCKDSCIGPCDGSAKPGTTTESSAMKTKGGLLMVLDDLLAESTRSKTLQKTAAGWDCG